MPTEFCPRQIIFEIPGNPGVLVTATENNGKIDFIVDVIDVVSATADLRGFFFDIDPAKLTGLAVTNADSIMTQAVISPNNVLDLGSGLIDHSQ